VSYDVTVFFRQAFAEPSVAVEATERITGSVSMPWLPTARVGCAHPGQRPRPYLRDEAEMPFSAFAFQADLRCSAGAVGTIHPVALLLAEEYSGAFQDGAMLCLNGVEFLGDMFERGRLVVDRMSGHQELFIGSRWRYQAG
jgi:hypothetical protein